MIWTVVKNNGKIAFVNHGGPQDERAHLSLIDLLVQTQIKPKAVPRLKMGALTLHHKVNKPKISLNSNSSGGSSQALSGINTSAGLKTSGVYKQQKGKLLGPLLELSSLLRDVEFTANKSKTKRTKQSENELEFPYTKPGFNICQSKINVLKSRLNLITYGDETAPAKGYFSNSDATFKSQLSHLLPHSDRKNKLFMSQQLTRFKNCKRVNLARLDLSKSVISGPNIIEEDEFIRSHERTYVQQYDHEHRTKNALTSTHFQAQNDVKRNSTSPRTTGYASYSQRYYSKINPMVGTGTGTGAALAVEKSTANAKSANVFNNSNQYKPAKRHRNLFSKSSVTKQTPLNFFKNVKDLHDINACVLNRELKTPYSKAFTSNPKSPMPYIQPYWIGTNVYEQMHFANRINSTKHFATNPFISQANLVIFSHPEKALGLVNQVRNLRIPTIGFVSGSNKLLHQTANIVDFHILGNAENFHFVACALQNFIRLLNRANNQPKVTKKQEALGQTGHSKHTKSNTRKASNTSKPAKGLFVSNTPKSPNMPKQSLLTKQNYQRLPNQQNRPKIVSTKNKL